MNLDRFQYTEEKETKEKCFCHSCSSEVDPDESPCIPDEAGNNNYYCGAACMCAQLLEMIGNRVQDFDTAIEFLREGQSQVE